MPQRTRVNRVPTHKQLQASSFENQVTLKPGEKSIFYEDDNQIEGQGDPSYQISVLESIKVSATPRSEHRDSQIKIFQAFDQYMGENNVESSKNLLEERKLPDQAN